MSNKKSTIHEFDFNLVCEYFSSIERQGPGSIEATVKALHFIENLNESSKIADIGCGTGGQTMVLASQTSGTIRALDIFPTFVEALNNKSASLKLDGRVKGLVGSMDKLPFEKEELDLIWSEGAIYNIGFKRGMNEWRHFLKEGGCIAVTEATWFTNSRPSEIEEFWQAAYPEIDTMANNIAIMQEAGYSPIAAFTLPEKCWTDNFYNQQALIQDAFLAKYEGNTTAQQLVAYQKHEADLYHKYKQYYGYAFYIGKKV